MRISQKGDEPDEGRANVVIGLLDPGASLDITLS